MQIHVSRKYLWHHKTNNFGKTLPENKWLVDCILLKKEIVQYFVFGWIKDDFYTFIGKKLTHLNYWSMILGARGGNLIRDICQNVKGIVSWTCKFSIHGLFEGLVESGKW